MGSTAVICGAVELVVVGVVELGALTAVPLIAYRERRSGPPHASAELPEQAVLQSEKAATSLAGFWMLWSQKH